MWELGGDLTHVRTESTPNRKAEVEQISGEFGLRLALSAGRCQQGPLRGVAQ